MNWEIEACKFHFGWSSSTFQSVSLNYSSTLQTRALGSISSPTLIQVPCMLISHLCLQSSRKRTHCLSCNWNDLAIKLGRARGCLDHTQRWRRSLSGTDVALAAGSLARANNTDSTHLQAVVHFLHGISLQDLLITNDDFTLSVETKCLFYAFAIMTQKSGSTKLIS